MSASDPNSLHPRLLAQSSAAAIRRRAIPRRRYGPSTQSPSKNATGLVSQPFTGSLRSSTSANPATSAPIKASHAANGASPFSKRSAPCWCDVRVPSGQSRARHSTHRGSADAQRTRRTSMRHLTSSQSGAQRLVIRVALDPGHRHPLWISGDATPNATFQAIVRCAHQPAALDLAARRWLWRRHAKGRSGMSSNSNSIGKSQR